MAGPLKILYNNQHKTVVGGEDIRAGEGRGMARADRGGRKVSVVTGSSSEPSRSRRSEAVYIFDFAGRSASRVTHGGNIAADPVYATIIQ